MFCVGDAAYSARPTTPARLATAALGGYRLLNLLSATELHREPAPREVEEAVYLTQQPWAARYPDHVFQQGWAVLCNGAKAPGVLRLLQVLADEFLESPHGQPVVKLAHFGVWQQSVMSRISGLPVLAAARAARMLAPGRPWQNPHQPTLAEPAPVLRPHDGAVEAYVQREGLHETHLHLNGSTHAEVCWLQALQQPEATVTQFANKYHEAKGAEGERLRELCHAVDPTLRPQRLLEHLRHAARLRRWLLLASAHCLPDLLPAGTPVPTTLAALMATPAPQPPAADRLSAPSAAQEVDWLTRLLVRLQQPGQPAGAPPEWLARLLHLYLLLQNQHHRLLVQEEGQTGFDQFQRLTFVPLRWKPEERYTDRLAQMHGAANQGYSRTGRLEGRFAPKESVAKNESEVLIKVLGDYRRYLARHLAEAPGQAAAAALPAALPTLGTVLRELDKLTAGLSPDDRRVQHLALVAHFIKQPDPDTQGRSAYRFKKLRRELDQKAAALAQTLARWPRLRRWVRGIDAAANELHAPPEVFAACWRACRAAGLTRSTYHAGEDFVHLASGLRAMHDALTLLELQPGDRIGHGTAMGIRPGLWLQRTPPTLHLARGDWLLDLLCAWQLLRDQPDTLAAAELAQREAAALGTWLLGETVPATLLEAAMACRHLHPAAVRTVLARKGLLAAGDPADTGTPDPSWSPSPRWQAELTLAEQAASRHPQALRLCWRWWSDPLVRQRSAKHQAVPAAFWNEATLLALQQALMRRLLERGVLVETLPSSNVRISLYEGFDEHHALRWLRAPGSAVEGDPTVLVSLGSDDPGIFAGDLSSEFYQLYAVLRRQGRSDQEALGLLAPMNERGRTHGFHAG